MTDAWTNAFLRRSPTLCPVCGMPLREVEAGRCGFCRSPLTLGLSLVAGYRTAWSVCMALLVAGAGFSSFIAILTLVWTPPGRHTPLMICSWSSLLFLAASAVAMMKRERFCTLSAGGQLLLTVAAGIAVLVLMGTFMMFMR